jgi:hypothetical protein
MKENTERTRSRRGDNIGKDSKEWDRMVRVALILLRLGTSVELL